MGDIGEQRAHYEVLPARGVDVEPVPQPVPGPVEAEQLTDPPGEH